MQPLPTSRSHPGAGRIAKLACAAAAVAFALAPLATSADAKTKLTLPAERTSPTGNFFTLEAYAAPTSSHTVANFEMKVCTSKHTPADTAIDPVLFTLALSSGAIVRESVAAAKSPAITLKPLKPLQCTEGWLGFSIPKGKTPFKLEYDYNGTISWTLP